jgi:hypothetical protein
VAKHRAAIGLLLAAAALPAACGKASGPRDELRPGDGGVGGTAGTGGGVSSGGTGLGGTGGGAVGGMIGTGTAPPCSDIFAQTLQTFSIDISAADWAAVQSEFLTVGNMPDQDFVQHQAVTYPVVFHYGAETVANVTIHLRGDSSWQEAAQFDGAAGKMQFGIAFDDVISSATFHGVSKVKLDMPRTDPTFMRDRIANTWLRSIDIPASCSTNAVLVVNGSVYGVYTAEESIGHHVVQQFFPGNAGGDLWDGGETPQTNKLTANRAHQQAFWDATTPAALAAIVDVRPSLLSWAAEALLNDGDGYWGGEHNFYIYDEGAPGFVFFPHDLDSSLDYLGRFDSDPITWWSVREDWMLPIPQHYLIVIHDDDLRGQYIEALRTQLGRFDVASIQASIDTAADQIGAAVAADPHRPTGSSPDDFDTAVALARRGIADRAQYVTSWLACRDSGAGADADGDGFIWCNDCRDDLASVHPGAVDVCGNHVDDDCNGVVDDGCP